MTTDETRDQSGPAQIEMMPPSPETDAVWYSVYCRECGIEEGMAHEKDSPMLVEKRDRHNVEYHSPAPSADRNKLAEEFAEYLGTEFYWCNRDHSAWAHGTMSLDDFELARDIEAVIESLVDIALAAPVEWEYAVQFKEADGDWTQPTWTNLATAQQLEREHGPASLTTIFVRRRKAGEPELISGLARLRGEGQ